MGEIPDTEHFCDLTVSPHRLLIIYKRGEKTAIAHDEVGNNLDW